MQMWSKKKIIENHDMKGMKLHKEQVVLAANQRVQSEKAETPEAPTDAKVCLARSGVVVLFWN